MQRYAVDDDVPPSEHVDVELQFESKEGNVDSNDSATANDCSQEIVGHFGNNVEVSQPKESKHLLRKWTSGAGPRINCVREYPAKLQVKALEQLNLSPRVNHGKFAIKAPIPSPRPSPKFHLSPRLVQMGLPSPRVQVTPTN